MTFSAQNPGYPTPFGSTITHGDLHPWNIMVTRNGATSISSIVDWETIGWYPDCRESARLSIRLVRRIRFSTGVTTSRQKLSAHGLSDMRLIYLQAAG